MVPLLAAESDEEIAVDERTVMTETTRCLE